MNVFSDVDGTFVDETGAVPFSQAELRVIGGKHRVVFASSRTAGELRTLQREIGWRGWAIAEDGAVLVHPDGAVEALGLPLAVLRDRLMRAGARAALERLEARSPSQPERMASVLLPREAGESAEWAHFRSIVTSVDLRCSVGGGWATLTAGPDKGTAVRLLCERQGWKAEVGIGNDGNDLSLLQAVDRPFVVLNLEGHHPALAGLPGVTKLRLPGPEGWKEMLSTL